MFFFFHPSPRGLNQFREVTLGYLFGLYDTSGPENVFHMRGYSFNTIITQGNIFARNCDTAVQSSVFLVRVMTRADIR